MPLFVGRIKELKKLREISERGRSALVVCQGRRRIGKSRLFQEFCKTEFDFFQFQGLAPRPGIDEKAQLKNFSEQIAKQTKLPSLEISDWTKAFSLLESQLSKKKTLVLLDEISWMASSNPDFVGKLKIAWDTQFKVHPRLILVICGSVSSWIEKNILNNTDFLGRVSLTLRMNELCLPQINEFWGRKKNQISAAEKFKTIGFTGGVPRYLEEINPNWSAEKNIQNLCFEKEGPLYDEFEKIFNDIFDKRASSYLKIVEFLVEGKKTFLEICEHLKVEKNGVISGYLKELLLSGFVERNYVFKFDGKASKQSKFRIKDNYLRFYLKYVKPVVPKIEANLFDESSLESMPAWDTIMGLQFENTLLNNLSLLLQKMEIPKSTVVSAAPYFQEKNSKNEGSCQIDLLIHTKNDCLYLCEFKFKKVLGREVIEELKRKIEVFKRPKHLSIRSVLVYCGNLQISESEKEFFSKILNAESLFKE